MLEFILENKIQNTAIYHFYTLLNRLLLFIIIIIIAIQYFVACDPKGHYSWIDNFVITTTVSILGIDLRN